MLRFFLPAYDEKIPFRTFNIRICLRRLGDGGNISAQNVAEGIGGRLAAVRKTARYGTRMRRNRLHLDTRHSAERRHLKGVRQIRTARQLRMAQLSDTLRRQNRRDTRRNRKAQVPTLRHLGLRPGVGRGRRAVGSVRAAQTRPRKRGKISRGKLARNGQRRTGLPLYALLRILDLPARRRLLTLCRFPPTFRAARRLPRQQNGGSLGLELRTLFPERGTLHIHRRGNGTEPAEHPNLLLVHSRSGQTIRSAVVRQRIGFQPLGLQKLLENGRRKPRARNFAEFDETADVLAPDV